ncbi:hypothetical protein TNCV_3633811 [Trichonephila clavipes]|nr:hypothetical protein TNCV_3633811 [Trichonephila clavipes]
MTVVHVQALTYDYTPPLLMPSKGSSRSSRLGSYYGLFQSETSPPSEVGAFNPGSVDPSGEGTD